MNKYGLILMDLDNTLFDFTKGETSALKMTFESTYRPFDPEVTPYRYRERSKVLWGMLEEGEITLEELRKKRWDIFAKDAQEQKSIDEKYVSFLSQQAHLFPDVMETIKVLSETFPLVAITNGITEVQCSRWRKSGLPPFFQGLIISGEVGWVKPDPRIFEVAFKPWKDLMAPEEVLMVGDSYTADMVGAMACGFHTCMVGEQQLPAEKQALLTWKVNSVNELPQLLLGKSVSF